MSPPNWIFSMADLEKAITPRTRGIIINTPANPSGKVFTTDELSMLAGFAAQHDLFVFTDEIYEHFLYDGRRHVAPATLDRMRVRTITISGLSKTFSITGWRIGYCICDERWTQTIGYFNDLVYVCAPAPLQMGVARGLATLEQKYYADLARDYEAKRDKICKSLSVSGLAPYIPEGAYYVLADISKVPGKDSKERAMYLLHKTGVACVPGNAFYHDNSGETMARFCFAKEDDILTEACTRLESLKLS